MARKIDARQPTRIAHPATGSNNYRGHGKCSLKTSCVKLVLTSKTVYIWPPSHGSQTKTIQDPSQSQDFKYVQILIPKLHNTQTVDLKGAGTEQYRALRKYKEGSVTEQCQAL